MKRLLLIALVFVISAGVHGAWIPLNPDAADGEVPAIHAVTISGSDTSFNVTVPGMHVEDIRNDQGIFQKLELPVAGVLHDTGAPQVPAIRKNIIVPKDGAVSLQISVNRSVTLDDYTIWPAQPSYKRSEEKPAFQLDERVYGSDALYPATWGRISQDAVMRDFRFVTVELNPIRINPFTGELVAATDLSVQVLSNGSVWGPYDIFPSFDRLYRNNLENYDLLDTGLRSDPEPMLIICHDAFMADMAPFVEWKTKRGIDVTMVSSTETGTSSGAIQTYIQNVWATWTPQPVFIVLVGDAPQLNPLYGIGSCASDSMFTLLEGGDLVPDVFISRMSAGSAGELTPQLDKIMTYELTPAPGDWLDKFAGLASSEGSGPSDEEYSQGVEERFLIYNPDSAGDRIYQSLGHGPAEISAAVNEGRFWLSYFGHGSGTSWSAPNFSNSNVDALTNGYMTPFIMDVSCSNGGFDSGSDCFAERWVKYDDGAVGMFSSSTSCSWHEPAEMAWGVCFSVAGSPDGSMPGGNHLVGQMTLDGIVHMYDVHGTGSNTEEVMNQYVLFGDCSMLFRSDLTITPDVSHLPSAPMAPLTFDVTVTSGGSAIEGAYVCAYKAGEVHEVGMTDVSGMASLDIYPQTVGDMIITVYGKNLAPQESIVNVAPAGCGVVALDRTGYNCDDTVVMAVFDSDLNADPGTVETVTVDISSDSEPTPEDVVLTETGPDTAQFTGSIMTSDSQGGAGYLLVASGDTISVHYYDEDCDGSPVDVYDDAGVDCTGPVISGVTVDSIGTNTATISWTTSEACDTTVMYGTTTPPSMQYYDDTMTTTHEVVLEGLNDCTMYRFMVQGEDAYGNIGIDDNGGAYYDFTTWELQVFFSDDIESGEGQWTYDGLWHIVPEASACNEAHSPTHSWYYGQESTCNFDTGSANSGTLTSPVIDLTGTTQAELHLWYWFEGESSTTYDTMDISVQVVGGSATVLDTIHETTSGWNELVADMGPYCGNEIEITFFFDTYDSVLNDYQGAYIDDVEIIAAVPCQSQCIHDGDVNLDGSITSGDAQLAFQIALGMYTPNEEEECAADCNGDESVTSGDAQQIFMTALGMDNCVDPM